MTDKEGGAPLTEGVVGGSITDGTNLWEITGESATDGTINDFEVPIGSDHQFSTWWWYRVAGDTAEHQMPFADTEDYNGSLATLTWSDVDGLGLFDATLNVFLIAQGPGGALLSVLEISNISGAPLPVDFFSYTDLDIDGTSASDSAVEAAPTQIDVTDVSTAFFLGNQADAYRVDAFPNVRNALNDDAIDDFASTGLPFGPGDFAGGYQWGRVVPTADSIIFETLTCINTLDQCPTFFVVFEDGFETGDTGVWDTTVP